MSKIGFWKTLFSSEPDIEVEEDITTLNGVTGKDAEEFKRSQSKIDDLSKMFDKSKDKKSTKSAIAKKVKIDEKTAQKAAEDKALSEAMNEMSGYEELEK